MAAELRKIPRPITEGTPFGRWFEDVGFFLLLVAFAFAVTWIGIKNTNDRIDEIDRRWCSTTTTVVSEC